MSFHFVISQVSCFILGLTHGPICDNRMLCSDMNSASLLLYSFLQLYPEYLVLDYFLDPITQSTKLPHTESHS